MPDCKIKILIVSRTPWNEANSFGNTFSNLFGGIENIDIANICCQGGKMNSRLINEAFQLTDKSVAKSIFGKRPGKIINNELDRRISSKLNVPRKAVFYVLREAIWSLGKWKSKALKEFIRNFNPDILYLPIYRSHYMCEVDKYVIKLTDAPYVVHISDDVYGFSPEMTGLYKCLQHIIRKDIRQIFKRAAYGEVFSPIMAQEYENEFKIPFHLIGKSVDGLKLPEIAPKEDNNITRFIYTGNYGGERGHQLVILAKCISETFHDGKAVLDIYSATNPDPEIESQLAKMGCVRLMGAISPDKLLAVQQQADYLVHVEGFSPKAIFEARLSFSTKIIDYLVAGRPIVAIGPQDVTSIQILKSNDMAYVATDTSEIKNILSEIAQGHTADDVKVNNGRKYLLNNRDASKMKADMYQRLAQLLKK